MHLSLPPLLLATAALAAALAPGPRPGEGAAPVGAVEGTVHLRGVEVEEPPARSPYARRRYRPPSPATSRSADPRNAVVFVLVDDPDPARADTTVQVVQRNRTIIPHVTVIQVGSRVEFPNRDDVFHNLFSLSDARPFNLGRYPPGESRSQLFDQAGVVHMFCDIHSEMNAVIRVVETPHFGRPGADGAYRIEGVPAGRHRVVAWHEAAGADTVEVEVPASGRVSVDLTPGR